MDVNNADNVTRFQEKICRICFKKCYKGLYELREDGEQMNLIAKIKKYLSITVSESDGLPKSLCTACHDKIESFHNFATTANINQISFSYSPNDASNLQVKSEEETTIFKKLEGDFQTIVESPTNILKKEPSEIMEVEVDPMWFLQCERSNSVQEDESFEGKNFLVYENEAVDVKPNITLPEPCSSTTYERKLKEIFKPNATITSSNASSYIPIKLEKEETLKKNDSRTSFGVLNSSNVEIMGNIENNRTNRRDNTCEVCYMGFFSESSLHNHLWMHCRPSTNGEEKNDENNPLNIHSVFNTEGFNNENACPICGKVVSSRGNLRAHLETHQPKGNYDCEICGRIFKTHNNLEKHQTYHIGEKHCCNVCRRVYSTNSTLRAHAISHSELRPHRCPICDKQFKRNQDLKFHINQHTGAKPYKCPYCPKAFASSGNCFSHRKRMHPLEVERDRQNAAKYM